MAQSVASQYATPAGALHAQLETIERLADNPTPDSVEELLVTLDAAEAEIGILDESSTDLGEDHARWDAIVQNLKKRPQLIAVPARGVPGGMDALRRAHPPASNFWWQADRLRSEQLRNQLIRALLLLVAAALIMWAAGWAWSYFFPYDPVAPTTQVLTALT